MNVTVIGYGSIGARHARILKEMGENVSVVSRHTDEWKKSYSDLESAVEIEQPQYIVVANKTQEHYETLVQLVEIGFYGKVLVEKPLFHRATSLFAHQFSQFCVAYNLRFHPVLQRIKQEIRDEKVLSVQVYAGQYLPDWRPERDYRKSYSISRHEGGGVLRDLSHELDYLVWLFGESKSVVALGGHYSDLEIETEDIVSILFSTKRCPSISLQLNYLDKIGQRKLIINTAHHTFTADLVVGSLMKDSEILVLGEIAKDHTYTQQHLSILRGKAENLCTAEEGFQTLQMIDAIESSIDTQQWVIS